MSESKVSDGGTMYRVEVQAQCSISRACLSALLALALHARASLDDSPTFPLPSGVGRHLLLSNEYRDRQARRVDSRVYASGPSRSAVEQSIVQRRVLLVDRVASWSSGAADKTAGRSTAGGQPMRSGYR